MKQDSFDGGDLSAMSSASRDGYSPRGAGHWQGGPWMSSGEQPSLLHDVQCTWHVECDLEDAVQPEEYLDRIYKLNI